MPCPNLNGRLLLTELLLSALLSLVGGIGVVQSSLEPSSDVVGVLISTGRRHSVGITAVFDLLKDLFGVLLGLVGCV